MLLCIDVGNDAAEAAARHANGLKLAAPSPEFRQALASGSCPAELPTAASSDTFGIPVLHSQSTARTDGGTAAIDSSRTDSQVFSGFYGVLIPGILVSPRVRGTSAHSE